MRILDMVTGWLLVAFGVLHLCLTRVYDPTLSLNALWFASGGLFMISVGALNLLRVAYAPVAKGVRIVSALANVTLVLLILLMTTKVPIHGNPQIVVGLVITALLTLFSLLPRGGQVRSVQAGR